MLIKIGRFELEVGAWMVYVRVPAVGELFWTPSLGLTTNREALAGSAHTKHH